MIPAIRPLAARLAAVELPVLALLVIGSIAVERLLPVVLVVASGFWLVRWLAALPLPSRAPRHGGRGKCVGYDGFVSCRIR